MRASKAAEPSLQVAHAFERRVPARFQFGRDQTHVGIDAFVATAGELRVVARLFDFELQRLSLLTMPLVGALRRFDRGVDGLRLDRLQHLLAHRVFDGLAGQDTQAALPVW